MLVALILGYCGYYFNRTQLTVTLPLIIKSMPALATDGKAKMGGMLSLGYFTFSVGRLVHGWMVDRYGGAIVFKYGLVMSIACSVAFTSFG